MNYYDVGFPFPSNGLGGNSVIPPTGDLSGTSPNIRVNQATGLSLYQDTAGSAIGQRNGSVPQTFKVYGTFTSSTVYSAGGMDWVTNPGNLTIGSSGNALNGDVYFQRAGNTVVQMGLSYFQPASFGSVDLGVYQRYWRQFWAATPYWATQTLTTATILNAYSPYRNVINSATAVLITLPAPAANIDGLTFCINNVGAGTATVSYTGRTGATTYAISQDNSVHFGYGAERGYWMKE